MLSGQEVLQIRSSVAAWPDPFIENLDPLAREALSLVLGCCNPDPRARPSAAQVAHVLDSMITYSAAGISSPLPAKAMDIRCVKQRAVILIEAHEAARKEKRAAPHAAPLDESDSRTLRWLVDQGDTTAAYLLGLAISYGYVEADAEEDDIKVIMLPGHDVGRGWLPPCY